MIIKKKRKDKKRRKKEFVSDPDCAMRTHRERKKHERKREYEKSKYCTIGIDRCMTVEKKERTRKGRRKKIDSHPDHASTEKERNRKERGRKAKTSADRPE